MATKRIKLNMLTICTHSGSFHADESLAVYLLRLLPEYKDAKLIRSRKEQDWDSSDIVVDVSGKYDGVKYFDHHQREFNTTFEGYSTKLSSAGLIYKHFGKKIIETVLPNLGQTYIDLLYDKMYREFIESLDANDNGISQYDQEVTPKFADKNITLPSIVSKLNPSWEIDAKDEDFDRQFLVASNLVGNVFLNLLKNYGSWINAKSIVQQAFGERNNVHESGSIIVLSRFCPWKEHLYDIEEKAGCSGAVKFVLFKDSSDKWRVSTVSTTATSFEFRQGLREEWRGLRDEELSTKAGIPGCIFVHAAGFIGGANTENAVMELAKKSLIN
jgi:uncharacterized UPF0160 family protein